MVLLATYQRTLSDLDRAERRVAHLEAIIRDYLALNATRTDLLDALVASAETRSGNPRSV